MVGELLKIEKEYNPMKVCLSLASTNLHGVFL
nr:MAG TPA: hypothetical protein [Caudoviricetes sp.]